MVSLRNISTDELLREIANRDGVRSIHVDQGEYHKTQVSGNGDSKLRYIRGQGVATILEIKSNS